MNGVRCEIEAQPLPPRLTSDTDGTSLAGLCRRYMMNSQSADRDSSADPTSSVEPAPAQTTQQAPNPLWLIAAAMAFFFTAAAFFLAAG
jgi:hypothetical protein